MIVNQLSVCERLSPFMKKLLQGKLTEVQYSTRSRNAAE